MKTENSRRKFSAFTLYVHLRGIFIGVLKIFFEEVSVLTLYGQLRTIFIHLGENFLEKISGWSEEILTIRKTSVSRIVAIQYMVEYQQTRHNKNDFA